MNVIKTDLEGVLIIEPVIFGDSRGFFMETYNRNRFYSENIHVDFVQDNYSYSVKGTLRGLHFQLESPQAKLVQVLDGEVFDVALDIRVGSPTFGKWTSVYLSGENNRQFFVPQGFAHGFCVVSETARFVYKCSDFYNPESEGGVLWSDPELNINWPVETPLLSDKDTKYSPLKEIPVEKLPRYRA